RRSAKGWETPPGQGRICSRSKSTKRGSSGRSGGRNPTTGSPGNDAAALKMAGKDGILMRCVAPALSGASLILAVLSCSGCAGRQPREDPAYVYHREAVNAYMERQYADALSLLETSLLLDGGNIVSWAHKGLFEEKLKDDEAALASYSRSIELIEKSKPGTYSLELPF